MIEWEDDFDGRGYRIEEASENFVWSEGIEGNRVVYTARQTSDVLSHAEFVVEKRFGKWKWSMYGFLGIEFVSHTGFESKEDALTDLYRWYIRNMSARASDAMTQTMLQEKKQLAKTWQK